jgi:hypothetical protein
MAGNGAGMSMLTRAEEIVSKLEAAGVRATIEPTQAMGLMPCVLVNIPAERVNDLNCGATVRWALDCLVPVPNGWDRTAWLLMEQLIAAVEATFPVERSRSQPFQRPGAAGLQSFPSYEMTFMEACE